MPILGYLLFIFSNLILLIPDVYYGGEALSADQPQSLTCPFCGKMGYTETSLQDHVTADHPDTAYEVVRDTLKNMVLLISVL